MNCRFKEVDGKMVCQRSDCGRVVNFVSAKLVAVCLTKKQVVALGVKQRK